MAKLLNRLQQVKCPKCETPKLIRGKLTHDVVACSCGHRFKVIQEVVKKPKRVRMVHCPECAYPQVKDRGSKDPAILNLQCCINCALVFMHEHAHSYLEDVK